jgi:hypothetical protein
VVALPSRRDGPGRLAPDVRPRDPIESAKWMYVRQGPLSRPEVYWMRKLHPAVARRMLIAWYGLAAIDHAVERFERIAEDLDI